MRNQWLVHTKATQKRYEEELQKAWETATTIQQMLSDACQRTPRGTMARQVAAAAVMRATEDERIYAQELNEFRQAIQDERVEQQRLYDEAEAAGWPPDSRAYFYWIEQPTESKRHRRDKFGCPTNRHLHCHCLHCRSCTRCQSPTM